MKTYGKALFSELMRIVLFPFHFKKIKKNRIVFTGLTGGTSWEYSGNPMYLCEYLMKNDPGKYLESNCFRNHSEQGIRGIRFGR